MTDTSDLAGRLTELEIRLSYQEQGQETLHEVVLALQAEIEALKARLSRIEGRLEAADDAVDAGTDPRKEPPPPHY